MATPIIIQCPHCHRMLIRDLLDVLRVDTFYCDCAGRGFRVKCKMEVEVEEQTHD